MKKLMFFLCITMSIFAICHTANAQKTKVATKPTAQVGKLTIKKDQDGHLIAIPQNMKKLENVVFVLQTSKTPKNFKTIELVNCSVNYQKTYIQFTSGKTVITFALDNVKVAFAKTSTVYKGFGVVKLIDPKAYSAYLAAINDPEPFPLVPLACLCVPNEVVKQCANGGAGSTQSSTETQTGALRVGCNVSCSSAAYACCNTVEQ